MPITKSAKKKLRADAKKTLINKAVKTKAVSSVKEMRKGASEANLSSAFSALDRAAKTGVFHKRKADRLKSRLAKLLAKLKSK